jgi:DNA-directed RNA polymerase specialized sigma24 family protein
MQPYDDRHRAKEEPVKAGRSDHFSAETYAQLKRIAENQIRKRRGTQSVGVTDLVHEAYDKLKEHAGAWSSRSHFMAVAVHAMWQVLVDHARRRAAEKRGGGRHRLTISLVDL